MSIFSVGGSTPSEGFELKSIRFNEGSSGGKLTFTPSVAATDGRILTYSFWFKGKQDSAGLNANKDFEFLTANVSDWDSIGLGRHNGKLNWYFQGGNYGKLETTAVYQDPSAWYHVVCRWNTTLATAGDRMKMYVNGEEVTSFSTDTNPSQNYVALNWNAINVPQKIANSQDGSYPASCYVAEEYMLDGRDVGPEYFGETNALTNQWQPKEPKDIKQAVTFGNNGWYLPFSNDALAASFTDSSGTVFSATSALVADILVVAGGGGGGMQKTGSGYGGGGGAGGLIYKTGHSIASGESLDVNVGAGGRGGYSANNNGTVGEDTTFGTFTAKGGGGGGGEDNGTEGGSGGGSSYTTGTAKAGTQGSQSGDSGTYGHGYAGGAGHGSGRDYRTAGGGGAGEVGEDSPTSGGSGDGGDGYATVIRTGVSTYYAGGGGGGATSNGPNTKGVGGQGGGGDGSPASGTSGADATGFGSGGGGGFGADYTAAVGGLGSDGIIVIRYAAATAQATGGTITSYVDGATTYQVHSFTDASALARHTITAVGNAKNTRISNHAVAANGDAHIIGPKIGSSAITFDGAGDELSIADSTDWNLSNQPFTWEVWLYPIDRGTNTWPTIIEQYANSNNRTMLRLEHQSPENRYEFEWAVGGVYASVNSDGPPNYNHWQHVAVCRVGNVFTMYIDGVAQTTLTNAVTFGDLSAPLTMGKWGGGNTSGDWKGYMDEIRISNVARYTANFTPDTTEFSSDANTMLLIHSNTTMGSTTFTDSSSTGHTITANGDVMHVAQKIGTGMVAFDGTGDYLATTDSSQWDFGIGNWTIEFYICFTGGLGAAQRVINFAELTSPPIGGMIETGADNKMVYYEYTLNSDWTKWCYDTNAYVLNTWYHYAIVRNGSNFKMYRDGVEQETDGTSSASIASAHGPYIGTNRGVAGWMTGYMDEIRISNVARYTSSFTPSTTAFKDNVNTLLLLHMDGGGGIDPATNLPTLLGQGTYAWDASTNAIFYGADGIATNKSLISFDGTGDYLSTPGSTDWAFTGEFTIEMWANGDDWNTDSQILVCYGGGGGGGRNSYQFWYMGEGTPESFVFYTSTDGNTWTTIEEAATLNLGRWYHIAVTRDSSNVVHIWLDGTELGSGTSDAGTYWTPTTYNILTVGGKTHGAIEEFDGYMDQVRISNTDRYPSAFTPSTTPFTTDANTLLLIQSDFSEGGLGADHSGNYNYFTPTNLSAHDMMPDSPMNNFATINPLIKTYVVTDLSEGNLKFGGGSGWNAYIGTIGASSGKWYWEVIPGSTNFRPSVIGPSTSKWWNGTLNPQEATDGCVGYVSDGDKQIDNSSTSYGASFAAGDIIGVALDLDAGTPTVTFYKNNATQGAINLPSTLTSQAYVIPSMVAASYGDTWQHINFGQDSSFAGTKTAQGNLDANDRGDFYYAPPSGFLALCTDNLPAPAIALPGEHFNTVLYTGNDADRTISGVGFQPDFLWVKERSSTSNNMLFDALRGTGTNRYRVNSNTTAIEITSDPDVTLVSDGFTVSTSDGGMNQNTETYVAWNWKGDGVSGGTLNEDGSIDSYVNVNTTAGFSIVKYTSPGSSSDETVGHGLSQAPDMVIVKNLDTTFNWDVWTPDLSSGYDMKLNTTDAQASGRWSTTIPSASLVTLKDNYEVEGTDEYIAYCFHSIEGYLKVGSYEGNGSTDGAFVYTGFSPAMVIIKNIDDAQDWSIIDNKRPGYNEVDEILSPNLNNAEDAGTALDFTSNGFKCRHGSDINNSNKTMIYIAFAESPFKTSNAR